MNNPDYPANEGQNVNNDKPKPDDANAGPEAPPFADPPPSSETAGSEADPNASAADEVARLNDQLLRLAAELENTRRRSEREKREAGQYAIGAFARDLIGVADNFERALRVAGVSGDDVPEERSDAFKALVEGIQMVERELLTILQRHGVHKVAPEGERFDPNLHQAVANVPSQTVPKGHVVDVAQPGFKIGDRVLRAAMVTVSAGAPAGGGAPGSAVDEEA